MPDVAEIAGRLSDAQREVLLHWPEGGLIQHISSQIGGLLERMIFDHLASVSENNATRRTFDLTETGLAVRAYLENSRVTD